MDTSGIGNTIKGAIAVAMLSARGTGRTKAMTVSLREGDTVVFLKEDEARRVRNSCTWSGFKIETVVCPPTLHELMKIRPRKRLTLDHSWVEAYYRDWHEQATRALKSAEANISAAMNHTETAHAHSENRKWNPYIQETDNARRK